MRSHQFTDHAGPIAMAHRGLHTTLTENSLEAIAAAVALGYRYIETDVHVSADGVAVLSHDRDLRRVAQRPEQISTQTWSQLSTMKLPCGSRLARLDEVLDSFPEVRFSIDAKVGVAVQPITKAIVQARATERVCVGSFSHRSASELRASLPSAAHSATPMEVAALRFGAPAMLLNADVAMIPAAAGPFQLATRAVINRAHDQFRSVHVWTVNDEAHMEILVDLGVDGLMTDRAKELKDLFVRRGWW